MPGYRPLPETSNAIEFMPARFTTQFQPRLMPPLELRRLDCTKPGRGPWRVVQDIANRSVNVRHQRSRYIHRVYYGTRTERNREEAETQAIALCAVLNALKAKRP